MDFAPALLHGPITRVADGVHIVRGTFRMGPGVAIGRTMTILEASDGLVVLNAIRLSEAGQAALDALGKVKHLVKLSDSHGVDEPFYAQQHRPEVWTLPNANVGTSVTRTRTLGPDGPIAGGVVIDFPGTSGWSECGYLVPTGGGTLVACDALQNHSDFEGTSFLGRVITPLMGFKGGLIVAPMWRKYQKVAGAQVRKAFEPLRDRPFQNLVTGHGPAVVGDADARTRAAIEAASATA
jgi:hypothetical protein